MVYAVPEGKNRVTARTVYTEVRVNRCEGVVVILAKLYFPSPYDELKFKIQHPGWKF